MNVETAEEFLTEWMGESNSYHPNELVRNSWEQKKNQMIAFAKLHVQAALKAACIYSKTSEIMGTIGVDEESIINSYPLNNIT